MLLLLLSFSNPISSFQKRIKQQTYDNQLLLCSEKKKTGARTLKGLCAVHSDIDQSFFKEKSRPKDSMADIALRLFLCIWISGGKKTKLKRMKKKSKNENTEPQYKSVWFSLSPLDCIFLSQISLSCHYTSFVHIVIERKKNQRKAPIENTQQNVFNILHNFAIKSFNF